MDFSALEAFVTVAEQGSFSRAAEALHLTQPAISKRVAALESELDARLFDRIGRRVLLTDAGAKLYQYARRIEEMTAEIRSEVTGTKNVRGALTIPGLEHPKFAPLDGKLHILHIPVMTFQTVADFQELFVLLWQVFAHVSNEAGGANASYYVLALGVQ